MHAGPFANIAHGNNSLIADRVGARARRLRRSPSRASRPTSEWRSSSTSSAARRPAAARGRRRRRRRALRHHGGGDWRQAPRRCGRSRRAWRTCAGTSRTSRAFGLQPVVAVNRAPSDRDEELELVCTLALEAGAFGAAVCDGVRQGGDGAVELAEAVVAAAEGPPRSACSTTTTSPWRRRSRRSRARVYGADGVDFSRRAERRSRASSRRASAQLPVCMAKTQLSLSPTRRSSTRRRGFTAAGPRHPRLHGRGLARAALRRHAADARASGPSRPPSASTSRRDGRRSGCSRARRRAAPRRLAGGAEGDVRLSVPKSSIAPRIPIVVLTAVIPACRPSENETAPAALAIPRSANEREQLLRAGTARHGHRRRDAVQRHDQGRGRDPRLDAEGSQHEGDDGDAARPPGDLQRYDGEQVAARRAQHGEPWRTPRKSRRARSPPKRRSSARATTVAAAAPARMSGSVGSEGSARRARHPPPRAR